MFLRFLSIWFFLASTPFNQVLAKESRFEFINLTKDFDRLWKKSKFLNNTELRRRFDSEIRGKFPAFYDHKFEEWANRGIDVNIRLRREFDEYPKYRAKFLNAGQQIETYLEKSLPSFKAKFKKLPEVIRVHIIHSFGEMDGGTRDLEENFYFIFGAESIAKYHSTMNFDRKVPFFHHELFHVYHRGFYKEGETLLDGLWAEGLAILAAKKLNPQGDLKQLSLDNPKGLLEKCEGNFDFLKDDVKKRLKFPTPKDYGYYFYGNSDHKLIPKRAGYCLGFKIASILSKRYSIDQMAEFNFAKIRKAVDVALSEL